MASRSERTVGGLKPVYLYDHLPGILAGFPAVFFLILALLSLLLELEGWQNWMPITKHMIFWMGMSITLLWYIAFRFNLPKRRFWLVFGLLGTFVGIPVILEITGYIKPFEIMGNALGTLEPSASSGAWMVGAMTFGIIWLCNLVWSRTHLRVKLDESGLTIKRVGGKGERFDLIGLKIEDEPIDYLETFMLGVGSLSLKTRMNKPIFTMKRVIGLYRIPIFPFRRGTLKLVEDVLSYQGKVLSVDAADRADMAEAADAYDDDALSEDAHEIDSMPTDGGHDVDTPDSPDIK